jgi:hypothetical protein
MAILVGDKLGGALGVRAASWAADALDPEPAARAKLLPFFFFLSSLSLPMMTSPREGFLTGP